MLATIANLLEADGCEQHHLDRSRGQRARLTLYRLCLSGSLKTCAPGRGRRLQRGAMRNRLLKWTRAAFDKDTPLFLCASGAFRKCDRENVSLYAGIARL